MSDPTWRRLLIELFDDNANKGSALLGYCLKELSRQGYHRYRRPSMSLHCDALSLPPHSSHIPPLLFMCREISHLIREAEYFQVGSNLLKDTLRRVTLSLPPHLPFSSIVYVCSLVSLSLVH